MPEQRSSTCSSAGTQRASPASNPVPEVRADVEDDAVSLDRARGVHGGAHGLDALVVHRLVRRGEIAEIERMHEHVLDPRLGPPLPEASEILLRVDGEVPRPGALGEQLHRVGADLGRPVDRPLDPAVAVGPEQHADNLASANVRTSPHGTEPDRLPPHRRRAHVPLQLALRARRWRRVPAPDREHRHEPRGRRVGRADQALALVARDRLGRGGDLPARPPRALPAGGAAARRGGEGVRGRRARSGSACPTRARPAGTMP